MLENDKVRLTSTGYKISEANKVVKFSIWMKLKRNMPSRFIKLAFLLLNKYLIIDI